jgi:hypothetical protein
LSAVMYFMESEGVPRHLGITPPVSGRLSWF